MKINSIGAVYAPRSMNRKNSNRQIQRNQTNPNFTGVKRPISKYFGGLLGSIGATGTYAAAGLFDKMTSFVSLLPVAALVGSALGLYGYFMGKELDETVEDAKKEDAKFNKEHHIQTK